MEKWIETKDLEEVVEALRSGLRVEQDGVPFVISPGGSLQWMASGGYRDTIPTVPGRIFRIEVPRPDNVPNGWEIVPHGDLCSGMKYFAGGMWIDCVRSGEQDRAFWYARKNEAKPAPKMARVAFFPSQYGVWSFVFNCITYRHQDAPSVLGPGGYEYEGFSGLLRHEPLLYLFDLYGGPKTLSQSATIEQIESGRAAPVLPVAYWYLKKEGVK